jgi:lipopolysaccharide export system permease protein
MKKIDVYIIRKFLGTFFFMIGAFVLIAIVVDVSENIDDLVKTKASIWQILSDYYLNFCFYFGTLLSPFIIFLSIIWFTSKLAQQSEIIAMLSGGITYRRIMWPYFLSASILVLLSLWLSHVIVPKANKRKLDFEVSYLKDPITVTERYAHREIEPGTIAYFYSFQPASLSGDNFSLEKWQGDTLTYKLMGSSATYMPDVKQWRITNAIVREWTPSGNQRVYERAFMDTILPMDEQDFGLRAEITSAMSYNELSKFIEEQRLGGTGRVAQFELEKHNRTAVPFSIYVLTLIGVSVASRKQRGGIGLHLMLAVVIGFIFVFISRMMAVSSMNLGLPAAWAVWVSNLIFTFFGLFLYSKAQK